MHSSYSDNCNMYINTCIYYSKYLNLLILASSPGLYSGSQCFSACNIEKMGELVGPWTCMGTR